MSSQKLETFHTLNSPLQKASYILRMSVASTDLEDNSSLDLWLEIRVSCPDLLSDLSRADSRLRLLYDILDFIYLNRVELTRTWQEHCRDLSKIRLLLTRSVFQLNKCQEADPLALDKAWLEQTKDLPDLKRKVPKFCMLVSQIFDYAKNVQEKMELFKDNLDVEFVARFAQPTLTMFLDEISFLIGAYDAKFHMLEMSL